MVQRRLISERDGRPLDAKVTLYLYFYYFLVFFFSMHAYFLPCITPLTRETKIIIHKQTLRRLAQNREAAKKSRLRKKAYVQQLENSRVKLAQIELDLHRARSQVLIKLWSLNYKIKKLVNHLSLFILFILFIL